MGFSEALKPVRRRLTFANLIAMAALFIALGGGAYAVSLKRNAVKAKHIAPAAVGTSELAVAAVTDPKIAPGAVTSGGISDGGVNGQDVQNDSLTGDDVNESTLQSAGPSGLYSPGLLTFLADSQPIFRFHNPSPSQIEVSIEMAASTGDISLTSGSVSPVVMNPGTSAVLGFTCTAAGACSGTPLIEVTGGGEVLNSALYTDAQGFRYAINAGDFTRLR